MSVQVKFTPKSPHQKEDCINQNRDFQCPNKSTQQASCGKGVFSATVRCCNEPKCMEVAAMIAKTSCENFNA